MDTPADLVVTGTTVHTLDPQTPTAEAFAVTGGQIAAVGTADDMAALAGPRTEVLDIAAIGGRAVVPGLADVHIHLGLGGGDVVARRRMRALEAIGSLSASACRRCPLSGPPPDRGARRNRDRAR